MSGPEHIVASHDPEGRIEIYKSEEQLRNIRDWVSMTLQTLQKIHTDGNKPDDYKRGYREAYAEMDRLLQI